MGENPYLGAVDLRVRKPLPRPWTSALPAACRYLWCESLVLPLHARPRGPDHGLDWRLGVRRDHPDALRSGGPVVPHRPAGARSPSRTWSLAAERARRPPRRTLAGIAADASTPAPIAEAAARRVLARRGGRILNQARSHKSDTDKWRRLAALRILRSPAPRSPSPSSPALRDRDPDRGAAVAILGARSDPGSAALRSRRCAKGGIHLPNRRPARRLPHPDQGPAPAAPRRSRPDDPPMGRDAARPLSEPEIELELAR